MTRKAAPEAAPIGVVVPVFRHSALVNDALISALDQDTPVHVVAVNDGCPHEQTHTVLGEYQLAHPHNFTYLRRPNGGLSAARNTGIRWLLRRHPDLDTIYLLDADNRLERVALRKARQALFEDDRIGWVYPDIDMFGLQQHWDYGGPYSLLAHRFMNICEAGSLVRADVFRKGAFFDETMKLGYEDWDFFLSAAGLGYVGRSLPEFGFRYRKRAESMLAESERNHAEIRSYIVRKHKALFSPRKTLELEQCDAPRFAIYDSERRQVTLTTDPSEATEIISVGEFVRRYWANRIDSGAQPFPTFLVAASAEIIEELRARRIIHWAFLAMEEAVQASGICCLGLTSEPGAKADLAIEATDSMTAVPNWRKLVHAMICGAEVVREVIADPSSDWLNSLLGSQPMVPLKGLIIHGRDATTPLRPDLDACWSLLALINEIKGSQFRDSVSAPRSWKLQGSLDKSLLPLMPWAGEHGKAPLLPRRPTNGRRSVAFVLPLAGFGGVEKVAAQVARSLTAKEFECHLVIWNENVIRADASRLDVFSTISFLNDPDAEAWNSANAYFGTQLSRWGEVGQNHDRALGILAPFDAVIFAHAASASGIAGKLRSLGVATLNHIHVTDITPFGRPVGHSHLAIAYEHSFDAILTCSRRLADWCEGFGVPREKVIPLPNAEGFSINRQDAARIVQKRREREGHPLNVLFMGRFDRQKGMERVLAIAERLAEAASDVRLRVVGERLLEGGEALDANGAHIDWAPATHDPEQLRQHYEWADVLLLPSHWEGLPLSVIEAQLFGVVPVVAEVGAVDEAVEHGRSGFLLDRTDVVAQALGFLDALSKDRSILLRLSQSAHEAGSARNWDASTEPLVRWLHRKLDRLPS